MRQIESGLQIACIRWLMLQYRDIWEVATAIPNGGQRPVRVINGRAICSEGVKLKREGVKAGVSDVIIFRASKEYYGLHIEFKTKTGRQSEAQKIWQKKMEREGYKYEICRSFEEFVKIIKDYVQAV